MKYIIVKYYTDLKTSYRDVFKLFKIYFSTYGGFRSLSTSPYFHFAGILTIVTIPLWSKPGWWTLPIGILPNIIGFTLSGYAVLMTMGDENFKKEMTRDVNGKSASAFMAMNVTFFHFLILQICAVILAIISQSRPLSWFFGELSYNSYSVFLRTSVALLFWAFSYLVFVYALTSALAASAAIFRVGRWFDVYMKPKPPSET